MIIRCDMYIQVNQDLTNDINMLEASYPFSDLTKGTTPTMHYVIQEK